MVIDLYKHPSKCIGFVGFWSRRSIESSGLADGDFPSHGRYIGDAFVFGRTRSVDSSRRSIHVLNDSVFGTHCSRKKTETM